MKEQTNVSSESASGGGLRRPLCWAILLWPLRISLAVFIFAPIYVALTALNMLGQWLAETSDDLKYRWSQVGKDTSFLLHGDSLSKAKENAEELARLRERWRRRQ